MLITDVLNPPTEDPALDRLFTPETVGGETAWHLLVQRGALNQLYLRAAVPKGVKVTPQLRAAAIGIVEPQVRAEHKPLVIAGLGAAWVWLGNSKPPTEIDLVFNSGRRRATTGGFVVREAQFTARDITKVNGVWVTNRARTARDIALWVPTSAAVPWITGLMHDGASPAQITDLLESPTRLVNRPQARRTLASAQRAYAAETRAVL